MTTPSLQSGSPAGILVLSNLSLQDVLRLFSLTLARMAQESIERYLPLITLSLIRSRTKLFLMVCRRELSVLLKKEENLSTEGGAFMLKPSICAKSRFSDRVATRSDKVERERRFLYANALIKAEGGTGGLPIDVPPLAGLPLQDKSRCENRISYLLSGDKLTMSFGLRSRVWFGLNFGITSSSNFVKIKPFV